MEEKKELNKTNKTNKNSLYEDIAYDLHKMSPAEHDKIRYDISVRYQYDNCKNISSEGTPRFEFDSDHLTGKMVRIDYKSPKMIDGYIEDTVDEYDSIMPFQVASVYMCVGIVIKDANREIIVSSVLEPEHNKKYNSPTKFKNCIAIPKENIIDCWILGYDEEENKNKIKNKK